MRQPGRAKPVVVILVRGIYYVVVVVLVRGIIEIASRNININRNGSRPGNGVSASNVAVDELAPADWLLKRLASGRQLHCA